LDRVKTGSVTEQSGSDLHLCWKYPVQTSDILTDLFWGFSFKVKTALVLSNGLHYDPALFAIHYSLLIPRYIMSEAENL